MLIHREKERKIKKISKGKTKQKIHYRQYYDRLEKGYINISINIIKGVGEIKE